MEKPFLERKEAARIIRKETGLDISITRVKPYYVLLNSDRFIILKGTSLRDLVEKAFKQKEKLYEAVY